MNTPIPAFAGFVYDAELCSKFSSAAGIFAILLKGGNIINHTPEDQEAFRDWLIANGIQDITGEYLKNI